MNSVFSRFRIVVLAFAAIPIVLTGCNGLGNTTLGGRPFIYKQGPGDAPSTIEDKAAVVGKRDSSPRAAADSAERGASAPAADRRGSDATPAARSGRASGDDLFGGYTQATRHGDLLFISGQIALDLRTGTFNGDEKIEGQMRQTMENIRTILENNRLTMSNVVSATVYLSSINNLEAADRVYQGFFKGNPPTRSVVAVASLPRGALVEISVIAGR